MLMMNLYNRLPTSAEREILLLLLLLPFFFLLSGCEEKTPPPGTVASVNGENISLHQVQALMDSRSAALGIPAQPSVAEMEERYFDALSVLIAYALVRQELQARGLAVSTAELDKAIAEIKTDYGEGKLEEFLNDAYLREDDWRRLMNDYLSLQVFTNKILLPSIQINLDEARNYYQKHLSEFKAPESWQICLKTAQNKAELEEWCKKLGVEFEAGADLQCLAAPLAEIPQPWQAEVKKMKALTCGKMLESDGEWRTMGLIAKNPAKTRKLSELYPIIERNLQQQKLAGAYAAWTAEKLAHADVKVAPEFLHKAK